MVVTNSYQQVKRADGPKGLPVDWRTYSRCGWCRLEQWARLTVGGDEGVFMYDGDKLHSYDYSMND